MAATKLSQISTYVDDQMLKALEKDRARFQSWQGRTVTRSAYLEWVLIRHLSRRTKESR